MKLEIELDQDATKRLEEDADKLERDPKRHAKVLILDALKLWGPKGQIKPSNAKGTGTKPTPATNSHPLVPVES